MKKMIPSYIPLRNDDGELRTVGFELEFSGVKLEHAAEITQSLYGGKIAKEHRYRYKVKNTRFGDFRIELDARNLRNMANENAFKKWGVDFDLESEEFSIEAVVDRLTQTVVPLEIVMPPVSWNAIEQLEALRSSLQENKAQGTKTSLVHAFGMHINIECPAMDSATLLCYLRAFMILYPWLLKTHKIDLARKVTPFVDRFPESYVHTILNPEYNPNLQQLTDDYLQLNATRNRPLDMMPVWELHVPEKVQKALADEKNRPRPAFHYRLPNSHIDDPEWRLKEEFQCWMHVEQLASNPDMVTKLSQLYLLQKDRTIVPFQHHWIQTITILLDLNESK